MKALSTAIENLTTKIDGLKKSEDGAILVTGLFASAFLIGTLWYVLGIGDALLFRERMQDGADAVAFAPSVLHARGMNLISLLNLTMASMLAIFVGVKIVQALLLIANILSCATCAATWGSYGCDDCEYLSEKESDYSDFVKDIDDAISDINTSLHDTADTVAKDMPVLAAMRGVQAGRDYARMVEGSFAASVSLISDSDSAGLGGASGGGGGGGGGKRLGLPVEDDDFSVLCAHSGTLVEILFVPTITNFNDGQRLTTTIMQWAGLFMAPFVQMSPSAWCGGGSGSSGAMGGTGVQQNGSTCLTGSRRHRKTNQNCVNGLNNGMTSLGSSSKTGESKKTSKKIFGDAKHGDDYFATWGFTESRFVETNKRGEKGTQVATWGKQTAGSKLSQGELDRRLRTVQLAKSEFYYDPRGGGPRDWDGIKDEGLWNLRWKARLRRVSQPNDELGQLFSGSGLSSIFQGNIGSTADIAGIVSSVLTASPDDLAAWGSEHVGGIDKTKRTGGIVH